MKTNIGPSQDSKVQVLSDFTVRTSTLVKGDPKRLILLLHGYSQSGDKILGKLEEALPDNSYIVAPSGPFPVPKPVGDTYKPGFSWYFYESERDEYFLDMSIATDYLLKFLNSFSVKLPLREIIGYSQGGYLAPFVAQKIPSVEKVIGISCEFLEPELLGEISFEMHAVHGENDIVVDGKNSLNSFSKLKNRGVKGNFHMVKGSDHGISDGIKEAVKKIIT
jgi:predicted esterase